MSEPSDKLLHNWVRQTLDQHRPDYDPGNWERLRPRLRQRRYWPWALLGLAVFLLGGLLIWFGGKTVSKETVPVVSQNRPNQLAAPSPKNRVTDFQNRSLEESKTDNQRQLKFSHHNDYQPVIKSTNEVRESVPAINPIQNRSVFPVVNLLKPGTFSPILSPQEVAIRQQMLGGSFGPDSTSYRALNRNIRRWNSSVVVCDFTSSMYPYSTQLFAWMKKNARNPALKALVLFTDCDSLGNETQANGPAGQLFVTSERDPAKALPVLLDATRNTRNNQTEAENDIEALLFAQKTFPDARHLVLIADMDNPVKDMALLDQVQKPVHVILCGRDWDSTLAFHPDYYTIARRTNGSLHTLEDDVDPAHLTPATWLRVGSRYYRYHRGKQRFVLTRFRHRPERLLGLFWW